MGTHDLLHVLLCGQDRAGKTTVVNRLLRESDPARRLGFTVTEANGLNALAHFALTASHAVIVLDAQTPDLEALKCQLHSLSVLGTRSVVLAVNKIDLAETANELVDRLERDFTTMAQRFGLSCVATVPVSAMLGYNIERAAPETSWYGGPTLLDCLRSISHSAVDVSDEPKIALGTEAAEQRAARFEATLVWTSDRTLLQGRTYSLRIGEQAVSATVAPLKYRIASETLERVPAKTLGAGEVGVCHLQLNKPVDFAPFEQSRSKGSFDLLDPSTNECVGIGLLHFALRRSENVRWQVLDVDKGARARLKDQRPCVIWFTGLSGAGKSTIANLVERELHRLGRHTYLLDGDNVRHGLNKDLGFTDADRVENIRRVAEVARLMVDAGLIVLVSFISPFRAERRMARRLVGAGEFVEVFVDAPLEVVEARDPKGLYRKARRGELKNFTGIDSPYEPPQQAELHLDTTSITPEQSVERLLGLLKSEGILE